MGREATPFSKVLPWVAFLSLMFFINYTGRSIIGPLLVYVEHDLGLDHSQATGLLMYMSAGFSVCLIFTGFVPARIRPRVVVAISSGGLACMLILLSLCRDPASLKLALAGCGVFAGLYFTSAMAAMGSVVSRENWSKAIALHELGPAFSFILAPLIAEAGIALTGSWRGALQLWGVFALSITALWLLCVRQGSQKSDPPSLKGVKELLRMPLVWFFCWCFAFGIAGEFTPYNVMSLHLTSDRGLNADDANHLLSITRLAAPLAVILGGTLAPRLGTLNTLRLFFLLHGVCLIVMGSPSFALAVPAMFLQGVMPSFVWPAMLSILPEHFPMRMQPTILSLTMPVAVYFGTGLAPKVLGIIGDHYSFSVGFVILGCLSILTLPFCSILKKPGRA